MDIQQNQHNGNGEVSCDSRPSRSDTVPPTSQDSHDEEQEEEFYQVQQPHRHAQRYNDQQEPEENVKSASDDFLIESNNSFNAGSSNSTTSSSGGQAVDSERLPHRKEKFQAMRQQRKSEGNISGFSFWDSSANAAAVSSPGDHHHHPGCQLLQVFVNLLQEDEVDVANHDNVQTWAVRNKEAMANKMCELLNTSPELLEEAIAKDPDTNQYQLKDHPCTPHSFQTSSGGGGTKSSFFGTGMSPTMSAQGTPHTKRKQSNGKRAHFAENTPDHEHKPPPLPMYAITISADPNDNNTRHGSITLAIPEPLDINADSNDEYSGSFNAAGSSTKERSTFAVNSFSTNNEHAVLPTRILRSKSRLSISHGVLGIKTSAAMKRRSSHGSFGGNALMHFAEKLRDAARRSVGALSLGGETTSTGGAASIQLNASDLKSLRRDMEECEGEQSQWSDRKELLTNEQAEENTHMAALRRIRKVHILVFLLLVTFNFFAVPTRMCVGSSHFPTWFWGFEIGVDIVSIGLAVARFFLPVDDSGRFTKDKAIVRRQYRDTYMTADIISLMPLQPILLPLVATGVVPGAVEDFARVNRMLHLMSFSGFFDDVAEEWLDNFHPLVHRIMKYLYAFFVYAFVTATPMMLVFRSNLREGRAWMAIQNQDEGVDFMVVLFYAFNIAAGRSYPNPTTEAQLVVMLFIAMLGTGSMAVIISGVTSLIISLVERSSKLLRKLDDVSGQLKHMRMCDDITKEVLQYYDLMFNQFNTFDYARSEEVFHELPMDLLEHLEGHMNSEIIKSITLFEKVRNPQVIRAIASGLEMYVIMPGTVICREGDDGCDMYFIAKGVAMATFQNFPELNCDLHEGDYFGQVSLLYPDPQHLTVITKTVSQLFALGKEHFDLILAAYPDLVQPIVDSAMELHLKREAFIDEHSPVGVHSTLEASFGEQRKNNLFQQLSRRPSLRSGGADLVASPHYRRPSSAAGFWQSVNSMHRSLGGSRAGESFNHPQEQLPDAGMSAAASSGHQRSNPLATPPMAP